MHWVGLEHVAQDVIAGEGHVIANAARDHADFVATDQNGPRSSPSVEHAVLENNEKVSVCVEEHLVRFLDLPAAKRRYRTLISL